MLKAGMPCHDNEGQVQAVGMDMDVWVALPQASARQGDGMSTMEALTGSEIDAWAWLQAHIDQCALVRSQLNGEDVAVLTHIGEDDDTGEFMLTPVAILVTTDTLLSMLMDPQEGLPA